MNEDIPENPQEVKKGKRGGGKRGRKRPWDLGFPTRVAPRPSLFAQFPAKHSSMVCVGDNPTLPNQTKQKTTPKTYGFPSSKAIKAFPYHLVTTMQLCIS